MPGCNNYINITMVMLIGYFNCFRLCGIADGVFTFENLCGAVAFRFNDYQEVRGMKIVNVTLTSKTKNISGWGYVDPATGELTLYGSDESDRYISASQYI